ncbi:MAG: hypothetical protein ABIP12_02775 [Terriglobales bacterium]
MTGRTRTLGFALLFFAFCFGVLAVVFPLRDRLKYFDYPIYVTLTHYATVALAMTLLSLVIVPSLLWKIDPENRMLRMTLRGILVFIATAISSVVIGTLPGEIADVVPIHGPFFAEWKFVRFTLYYGTLISFASAASEFVMNRHPAALPD